MYGVVVVRVIVSVPPEVVLPATIGHHASLNLFVNLVGTSAGGKSATMGAAESWLCTTPEIECVPVGSGEGLAKQFAYVSIISGTPVQEGLRYAALLDIDEIDTLVALMTRGGGGQTLGGSLRTAFSGGRLGFGYGDPKKSPKIERDRYRLGIVLAAQPSQTAPIFAGAGSGTPQRFLWFPVNDSEMLPYTENRGPEPADLILRKFPERKNIKDALLARQSQ